MVPGPGPHVRAEEGDSRGLPDSVLLSCLKNPPQNGGGDAASQAMASAPLGLGCPSPSWMPAPSPPWGHTVWAQLCGCRLGAARAFGEACTAPEGKPTLHWAVGSVVGAARMAGALSHKAGCGPVVLSQVLWVQASEGEMRDISNQRGLRGPSREPDGQLATSPRPGGRDIGPVSMVTWLVTDLRTSGTLSPAQTQDSWAGQTRSSTSTLSPNTQCIP